MKLLYSVKRASDSVVKETDLEVSSLKDAIEGADIFIKNKSVLGYCMKDFDTKEILVKKGDI